MKRSDVYILGGYQTDFARNWRRENKHIVAMMREAFDGAVYETRVEPQDIGAVIVGNFAAELYCAQGQLGGFCVDFHPALTGVPTMRVEAACAAGAAAVLTAMAYVRAGMAELVCVIGVEQMKTVDAVKGGDFLGAAAWQEREAQGLTHPFTRLFGRLGDEYEKRYGLDRRYLAAIAAINHRNALCNPRAQTRTWFLNAEHANKVGRYNPMISNTLRATDCCPVTDGAVCVFVASERYASGFASRTVRSLDAIPRVLGWGHTTATMAFDDKTAAGGSEYVLPVTRRAISDAFARAGIAACWGVDAIETHDCFTTSEYMAIDHFGITKPGEGWKAIEDGTIEIGGRLPVNPSGGLMGVGHPVGATGTRQVLDAYRQVTGTAGGYQVEGAKKVATLNIGGTATTNVCLVVGV